MCASICMHARVHVCIHAGHRLHQYAHTHAHARACARATHCAHGPAPQLGAGASRGSRRACPGGRALASLQSTRRRCPKASRSLRRGEPPILKREASGRPVPSCDPLDFEVGAPHLSEEGSLRYNTTWYDIVNSTILIIL